MTLAGSAATRLRELLELEVTAHDHAGARCILSVSSLPIRIGDT